MGTSLSARKSTRGREMPHKNVDEARYFRYAGDDIRAPPWRCPRDGMQPPSGMRVLHAGKEKTGCRMKRLERFHAMYCSGSGSQAVIAGIRDHSHPWTWIKTTTQSSR